MTSESKPHTQIIEVRTSVSSKLQDGDKKVQHLPFSIDYNGAAKNMDEYFVIEKSENGVQHSAFRGRPIKSKETAIPDGYTGLVIQESSSSQREDEERSFMVQHQFKSFTHWELDNPPNSDNQTQKSLNWLSLSQVLHETITE